STGATYTLTFQGYDFDGANEETITMNGNLVASVPAVLTPANGATWVAFTFDITSFLVQGTNTLSFTHANSDCPTNDQVRNLLVSNQTNTIYSNATAENINTATNCTNTLTYTFTIGAGAPPPPPSTGFAFLPSSPVVNSPVAFTATTTGGTAPYTISWSFGDGATGVGAITTHTYTTAQSFTVTETATDSSSPSQNAVSSQTIIISALPPPSTSFTFLPASPMVNTPVTFTATTSGGTSPYSVTWNFGDGTSGTGTSVIHTFTSAQSLTVRETATDSTSPTQTAISSQSVTVVATTPPLSATLQVSSSSPQVGQTVTFTASMSGGTSPYTYAIAFGDGATGTGSITAHAYSIAGSYTAKVTVTDSASPQASVTSSVTVNVQALVPLALAVPGNQTVIAGTWIN